MITINNNYHLNHPVKLTTFIIALSILIFINSNLFPFVQNFIFCNYARDLIPFGFNLLVFNILLVVLVQSLAKTFEYFDSFYCCWQIAFALLEFILYIFSRFFLFLLMQCRA